MDQENKAKDQAKQEEYEAGVAKTEKALRSKVSGVCRNYCL